MDDQGSPLLHRDDLVEDREVATAEKDQLAHTKIALQLAELVMTVPTPSNIALYGPWGSGKSGIGNLLRDAVLRRKGTRFARFDAFKYAETPLRRNFISAVASQLQLDDARFHDGLYAGRTRTDVTVPASKILRIIGIFLGLIVAISAVIVVVVALIALLLTDPFGTAFSTMAKGAVTAGLVPAALLSALITLAGKAMQVERSISKPDSDEQFEQIFSDLVKDSKAERLVIFVDELDRCAAEDVVETLDAVRTFLGVAKCVFVIAADQQVLEASLTRSAKQETPPNEVNPYYSTGSAYLDKVFQYQVSLPPLLSQRITRFAADLVRGKGGLWSEINTDYVISVLVPTHVASPRRVKHLINAFAMTYRLAQDRYQSELLSENPRTAAASIAKLVCLRVEFPLFARDLEIDARLPEIVLSVEADSAFRDATWSDHAVDRAKAYAQAHEAPAMVIGGGDDEDDADGRATERTTASSNQQLLDYLHRTKGIVGPSRDLVFMHSSGAAFGLDGQTALSVETAAENGDIEAIAERLGGADVGVRQGVVELLTHLIRTGIGVGAPNAARALLRLYSADAELPVERVADAASEAIAVVVDEHPGVLDDQSATAAWALAAKGTSDGSARLRSAVLYRAASLEDADCAFVLSDPTPALTGHRDEVSRLAARAIVSRGGEERLDYLREYSDATLIDFLTAVTPQVAAAIADAITAEAEFAKAQQSAAATPANQPAVQDSTADPPIDPKPILRRIAEIALERADTPDVIHRYVKLLLKIDRREARDAVGRLLDDVPPTRDSDLVDELLAATRRRALGAWPDWLRTIEIDAIDDRNAVALRRLADSLWATIADGSDTVPSGTVKAAAHGLARLASGLTTELRPDVTDAAAEAIGAPLTTDEEASVRSALRRRVDVLASEGLVDKAALSRRVLPELHGMFSAQFVNDVEPDSPLAQFLNDDVPELIRSAELGGDEIDFVNDAVNAIAASDRITEPLHIQLILKLILSSGVDAHEFENVPDIAEIARLIKEFGADVAQIVTMWIRLLNPDVLSLATVIDAMRDQQLYDSAAVQAVVDARQVWTRDERIALLRSRVTNPDAAQLKQPEVRLLGLDEIDELSRADLIIERFQHCENNRQRRSLIDLLKNAKIIDQGTRKRLIDSVILPLLGVEGSTSGVGQAEIALDALQYVADPVPRGTKNLLAEAVKNAVKDNDALEKKAVRVLEPLGFATERRGLLGRKKIR